MKTILLDPVDFDALHLSALEFGGIGAGDWEINGIPHCKSGHANGLDIILDMRLYDAGLTMMANDDAIAAVGVEKVPFLKYIKLLNIDVKVPA